MRAQTVKSTSFHAHNSTTRPISNTYSLSPPLDFVQVALLPFFIILSCSQWGSWLVQSDCHWSFLVINHSSMFFFTRRTSRNEVKRSNPQSKRTAEPKKRRPNAKLKGREGENMKKRKKLAKLRIQTDSVGLSGVFGSEVSGSERKKQASKQIDLLDNSLLRVSYSYSIQSSGWTWVVCVCVVRVHVRRTQSSKKCFQFSTTSRFPFLLPLLTRPHLLSGRFGLFSPGDRNLWWNLAIWCLLPLLLLLLLPLVSLDVAWCPSWMTLALGSVYLCGHAPFLYFAHSDNTQHHTARRKK